MEALALGRPVITTAVAGIPELVDSECGWLVPAGSEEALVEAMRQALAASPAELRAKGEVGRERVRRMHDGRRNAEELLRRLLILDNPKLAAKAISTESRDTDHVRELAVDDEAGDKERVGRA